MTWSDVFHRGARRLADPTTYVILLITSLAATVPITLLGALNPDSSSGRLAVVLLSIVWGVVVAVFTWGALTVAATEDPRASGASGVFRITLARFGYFLAVVLLLVGMAFVVALCLCVPALIGLGGTTTSPLLALLTPVFLIVGGIGVLVAVAVARLAFAAVALEASRPMVALRQAWSMVRTRRSDVLLWFLGDGAMLTGGLVAVVTLVAAGGAAGVLLQGIFLLIGTGSDIAGDGIDVDAGVVGISIFVFIITTFASILAGAACSFTAGTAVGLYDSAGTPAARGPARLPAELAFCDQCGTPRTGSSSYCDACGAAVAVG